MGQRDEFSAEVKRALRERVGGRCSRPECGRTTVSPNEDQSDKVDITGRAAHISAASEGGPRFNPEYSSDQRRSIDNGIWLCADCADLVDKQSGASFSEEQLKSWKTRAEEDQRRLALLRHRLERPTWLDHLSTPHFINVPRLLFLVGQDAITDSTKRALEFGFPRDKWIVYELRDIAHALRRLTIKALDVRALSEPWQQLSEGLPISFRQYCRTKSGANANPHDVENFNFARSPLIYLDQIYRYVFPYDPKWLTTSTARSDVRSGGRTFAGIGLVKNVDHLAKQVIVSPLTFGIPNFWSEG